MSKEDKLIIKNINSFGCHILKVAESENEPAFAYSIGIEFTRRQPDLAILGLDLDLAHWMINKYCSRIEEGEEFKTGEFYSGFLEGHDVCFVEIDEKYYEDYFGFSVWLYKNKRHRMLQLIWPTTDGKWPWDEEAIEFYNWAQPILNLSGKLSSIAQSYKDKD